MVGRDAVELVCFNHAESITEEHHAFGASESNHLLLLPFVFPCAAFTDVVGEVHLRMVKEMCMSISEFFHPFAEV